MFRDFIFRSRQMNRKGWESMVNKQEKERSKMVKLIVGATYDDRNLIQWGYGFQRSDEMRPKLLWYLTIGGVKKYEVLESFDGFQGSNHEIKVLREVPEEPTPLRLKSQFNLPSGGYLPVEFIRDSFDKGMRKELDWERGLKKG